MNNNTEQKSTGRKTTKQEQRPRTTIDSAQTNKNARTKQKQQRIQVGRAQTKQNKNNNQEQRSTARKQTKMHEQSKNNTELNREGATCRRFGPARTFCYMPGSNLTRIFYECPNVYGYIFHQTMQEKHKRNRSSAASPCLVLALPPRPASSCPASPCRLAPPCHASPCLALPRLALPRPAPPRLVLPRPRPAAAPCLLFSPSPGGATGGCSSLFGSASVRLLLLVLAVASSCASFLRCNRVDSLRTGSAGPSSAFLPRFCLPWPLVFTAEPSATSPVSSERSPSFSFLATFCCFSDPSLDNLRLGLALFCLLLLVCSGSGPTFSDVPAGMVSSVQDTGFGFGFAVCRLSSETSCLFL